jgi:hypothetical protein
MAAKKNTAAPAAPVEEIDESLAEALGEATPDADPTAVTIQQIVANIERAGSLAEAENAEGLAELEKETESLISSLPQRGRMQLAGEDKPRTWAEIKKIFRGYFRDAAKAAPKADESAPKGKAVATKAEPAAPTVQTDYSLTEGVSDLVNAGAGAVEEGVRLHVKGSQTARQIAEMALDIQRRIVTADGVPDLRSITQATRDARSDIYRKAETILAAEGDKDHAKSLVAKIRTSVNNVFSDVLVGYIRSLDTEAGREEFQQHYGKVAAAHPELSPAEAIFTFYNIPRLSKAEQSALNQANKRARLLELEEAKEAAKEGDSEAAEKVETLEAETVQQRIAADIQTADKAIRAAVKVAKDLSPEEKLILKAKMAELMALVAEL